MMAETALQPHQVVTPEIISGEPSTRESAKRVCQPGHFSRDWFGDTVHSQRIDLYFVLSQHLALVCRIDLCHFSFHPHQAHYEPDGSVNQHILP